MKALIKTLLCVAAVGIVLRVSFHDSFSVTAAAYYALTPMVIAIILAAAGVLLVVSHRYFSAGAVLLAGVLMAVVEATGQLGSASCADFGPPALRVITWNIGGSSDGWRSIRQNVADVLAELDANIILLSEANAARNPKFWRARLPGYSVTVPGAMGLVILSKSSLWDVHVHELGRRAYLVTAHVDVHEHPLEIFMVDFPSSPRATRQRFIQNPRLLRPPAAGTGRILMGDFNTPRDSTWFAAYQGLYSNAFDQSGAGWRKTWPAVLPVLDIDHIWTAGNLQAVCTRVPAIRLSDHRPVIADLAWNPN
ncbi:MAG: endonuclease/exonuclease/phosphatase family protein [Candidatus Binatia bacterium]